MSEPRLLPGITLGSYPQKAKSDYTALEQAAVNAIERLKRHFRQRRHNLSYVVKRVNHYEQEIIQCPEGKLDESILQVREDLRRNGLRSDLIFRSFAIIREAAKRSLGKSHYDVQLYGGWLMINGTLAEMETGEGKTLTTTLPACTAALAGVPVHVITANDYLASRDCEIMQPLYERLGIQAAHVIDGMEKDERRQHYRADIVHTTNKQIAFDYLRDRIEMGEDTGPLKLPLRRLTQQRNGGKDPFFLPGLCFALVDEADSVLIDEAKTPLIISKTIPNESSDDTFSDALYLASVLFVDQDYLVDEKTRVIELTEEGEENLAELIIDLPKQWKNRRKREMLVKQALNATQFYKKDRDYVVDDGKVQIIDQSTGRLMPDRSWEQGLHQLIEAKEGCLISEQREPLARITYQRFYSRYLRLGGASGTLSEVADELRQVYGLDVVRVPTFKPNQRRMMKERLYRDDEARKNAFRQRIKALHEEKRPVLIGTCSVLESEQVSIWLAAMGLPHQVLNAKQDAREAEIISLAGLPGAITVATNMAGRGTDISLHSKVRAKGGLHVLALCRNESERVDRQLYGRCARQGDPGSAEAMIALTDPTIEQFYFSVILRLLSWLTPANRPMPEWIGRRILRWPQISNERRQRRLRQQLMREDRRLQRILAFSGKFE